MRCYVVILVLLFNIKIITIIKFGTRKFALKRPIVLDCHGQQTMTARKEKPRTWWFVVVCGGVRSVRVRKADNAKTARCNIDVKVIICNCVWKV